MAFFQNKNSLTTALLPPLAGGLDTITTANTNWTNFKTDPAHALRRQAFQEFVFLLYYYQNRTLNGQPFPHNNLYDNVFRFFVEHDANGVPMNGNTTPQKIFTPSGTVTGAYDKNPGVTNLLPALRTIPYDAIQLEINASMTGLMLTPPIKTTMGLFEEASIIFSYFYLTRQLFILNGYTWNYSNDLFIDTYGRYFPIIATANGTFAIRQSQIQAKVNLPATSLPSYFNSLLNELTTLGFKVPSQPYTTPADQTAIAYLVMLLDPSRPVGVVGSPTPRRVLDDGSPWNPGFGTASGSVAIEPAIGLYTAYPYNTYSFNNVVEDFYNMIGSSTYYTPSAGATGMTVVQAKKEIKKVYDALNLVTQEAVKEESNFLMRVFIEKLTDDAINSIIATGVGNASISLLGLINFGLPLFNYQMEDTTMVKDTVTSITPSVIDNEQKYIVHLGVYALDAPTAAAPTLANSQFQIQVDAVEIYKFTFNPSPPAPNRYINVVSIPSGPGVVFYNSIASNGDASFFKKITVGTVVYTVLFAQYISADKDLIFNTFTTAERTLWSIPATKSFKFYVKSAAVPKTVGGPNIIFEELQTLVSIFKLQTPQQNLLNANVNYDNDTFQLYSTPTNAASFKTINKNSYDRIFAETDRKATIRFILDLLKEDANHPTSIKTSFDSPVLFGSFVGKSITPINRDSPSVDADLTYKPKYPAGAHTEHAPSSAEKTLFPALRYSYASIDLNPDLSVTNGVKISITIKSYVSPSPSSLSGKYSGAALTLFNSKKGSGSNNQVLAMLRSFGLLEALVQKMLWLMNNDFSSRYNSTEKAYMTSVIKTLFPDPLPGGPGSTTIICTDEPLTGGTVLAGNINRDEYEQLKIW